MPSPLIAALRKRNLTLTAIARIIHPDRGPDLPDTAVRRYLPHLSRHINGHEPIYRESGERRAEIGEPQISPQSAIRSPQSGTLNPTWHSLRRVLTGEEFDAALAYATAQRTALDTAHPR